MVKKTFFITNRYKNNIYCVLDKPQTKEKTALVILSHGFADTHKRGFLELIAQALVKKKIAVLRYDMPGCGKSTGVFGKTSYSRQIHTLSKVIDKAYELGYRRIGLAGHSMGGTVSLLVASTHPKVNTVVTLNSPAATLPMIGRLFTKKQVAVAKKKGFVDIPLWEKTYRMHYSFFQDLEKHDVAAAVKKLYGPTLFIQGLGDKPIYLKGIKQLFKISPSEVKFLETIPQANHFFIPKQTRKTLVTKVTKFFVTFLEKESSVIKVFLRHKGQFLIMKRNPTMRIYPGKWNTVAGFRTPDSLLENAYREVLEETGLTKKQLHFIKKGKPYKFVDKHIDKVWKVEPVLFETTTKQIKLDWEHTHYKWIYPKDISKFNIIAKSDEKLYHLLQ